MNDEEIDKLVKIANHKAFKMSDYYGRALGRTANLLTRALDAAPGERSPLRKAIARSCQLLLEEAAPHFDAVYGDEK